MALAGHAGKAISYQCFHKAVGVVDVRTDVMDRCRVALLDGGSTVSSETTANLAIKGGLAPPASPTGC
jgi:hypothetical protein